MSSLAEKHGSGAISPELFRILAHNEKMAELGRISAGVVHELNSPLSVITSAAQMIMREEGLPEHVREMLDRIGSEAQRLSQLTRSLLGFSRQDSDGNESDINLTIEFILDFVRFEASQRGVEVVRQLDYRLPQAVVNGNALKQILLNIVINALQAMEASGGILQIDSSRDNSGRLVINIADNGPGIPADVLEKIFEPYYTTKQPGEGTGLGLYVTRTLVENSGGELEVSSTAGKGTIFTIRFESCE